jgi:hypothetical protein
LTHQTGKPPKDPFFLPLFGKTGLSPPVAQVDGAHGLNKHSGTAVGNVMNDTRHASPHFRLDKQDHSPITLGNDGFLHQLLSLQPTKVPLHHRIQALVG